MPRSSLASEYRAEKEAQRNKGNQGVRKKIGNNRKEESRESKYTIGTKER